METKTEKTLYEKLGTIDERYWYLAIFIVVIIPLLIPFAWPMQIGTSTQDFYNFVKTLKRGSILVFQYDNSPSNYYELAPGGVCLIKQCISQGVSIIFWSLGPTGGPTLFQSLGAPYGSKTGFTIVPAMNSLTYGTDWIWLGYIAGEDTAVASMAANLLTPGVDAIDGKSLSSYPLMQKAKSAADVQAVCEVGAGTEMMISVVRRWAVAYKVPMLLIPSGGAYPTLATYYTSGVIKGVTVGIRGNAEYELLISSPGGALTQMNSMTFGHILFMVLVVICNVAYFGSRRRKT